MAQRRILRWSIWAGLAIVSFTTAAGLSSPLWLGPLAARRASAVLGRPVEIGQLHLRLGSPAAVIAEGVVIGNPPGFLPGEEPFLRIPRLTVWLNAGAYLRRQAIVIPLIELDRPVARAVSTADGRINYGFKFDANRASDAASPEFGAMRIIDGHARVLLAELRADFEVAVSSVDATGQEQRTIKAEARGTYADQPLAATFLASGLPSQRDPTGDWPVELHVANGPTRASLRGTLQVAPKPRAASLDLQLVGPDMALLRTLTGVPLLPTPPYDLGGKLDYTEGRFHFTGVAGRVGRSDVEGTLTVTQRPERPELTAELRSRSVDLRDIAGLLGGEPGSPGTPGQTPQQQKRAAQVREQARANPRLLPDRLLNLPKLRGLDAHLVYHAERIQGRSMPLDDLTFRMDVVDGAIALRPLSFGVGAGRIVGDILLTPAADEAVEMRAEARFERLDLARLMQATGRHQGAGALSGMARVEGTGRSVADILGHGDGALVLSMTDGTLSKLLVDLTGLRLGSALLTSFGGGARTRIECFVADLALRRGTLSTRALLLETEDAVTEGQGLLDLEHERVEMRLRTTSKHLAVGVMPVPLLINETLKAPSAAPDRAEGASGGIASALAALPTIQFGIGDDQRCEGLVRRARREAATGNDAGQGGAIANGGRR